MTQRDITGISPFFPRAIGLYVIALLQATRLLAREHRRAGTGATSVTGRKSHPSRMRSTLYSPLAWVIIGRLVSSTLIARLVTPVMYRLLAPALEEPAKSLVTGEPLMA